MAADLRTRRLAFAARSLVVVGGVPGAGKTTLLQRVGAVATRAGSRRWLLGLAWLANRPAHLVLLDIDAGTARSGQLARGRAVSAASQRRHTARWRALRGDAAHGALPGEGWTSVRLLDRVGADALGELVIERPATTRPSARLEEAPIDREAGVGSAHHEIDVVDRHTAMLGMRSVERAGSPRHRVPSDVGRHA